MTKNQNCIDICHGLDFSVETTKKKIPLQEFNYILNLVYKSFFFLFYPAIFKYEDHS